MLSAAVPDRLPAAGSRDAARTSSLPPLVVMAVPEEHRTVLWVGQVAVVSLPAEIDISNADQVREDLLSTINRGPALLVADMSATTFCDSAGVNGLVRAFKRATASGAGMRLVVSAPAVQRILAITGVDHLIDIYPSVAAAMAATDQPAPSAKPGPGNATTHADDGNPNDRAAQTG
jgi:anti-sigma B factor antagonist